MSDKIYVGQRAASLKKGQEYKPFSRVTMWYDDEHCYTAGDDTGRTLEVNNPHATQQIVDNVLKSVRGYVYRPFEATGVDIDPAFELGDAITINGLYSVIAQTTERLDAMGSVDISAPGSNELSSEYPITGPVTRELQRRMKLGQRYQGVKIDRLNGLTIVEVLEDGGEGARVVLNTKEFSFYDAASNRVLYFDPASGTYKFTGELNVADNFIVDKDGNVTINGSLTMTGTSNWLQTRYSTNKNASAPEGWQEAWDEAWSNTSTQVWAIYSYDGGRKWTQPMLAQGKDGSRGPSGPSGSDANVPDWVNAYTESARFNTLVTDEWVVTMNLFGSKIFGGEFYDDTGKTKLVLNPSESHLGVADLILYGGGTGKEKAFSIYDNIDGITLSAYGVKMLTAGPVNGGVAAHGTWDFERADVIGIHATFA